MMKQIWKWWVILKSTEIKNTGKKKHGVSGTEPSRGGPVFTNFTVPHSNNDFFFQPIYKYLSELCGAYQHINILVYVHKKLV